MHTNPNSNAEQSWSDVSPADIEARLASLGSSDQATDSTAEVEPPSLAEQFLADPTQVQLNLRSVETDSEGQPVETVTCLQRVKFAVGQKREVVHLAFHPDFQKTPRVSASTIEVEARVRITHVAQYGARLEVILPTPCEIFTEVMIESICVADYNSHS